MGLLPGIVVGLLLSPPSPEAVRAAVHDVYVDGDIQREAPARTTTPEERFSPRRAPYRPTLEPQSPRERREVNLPEWLLTVLLYGGGLVVLVLLVLALVGRSRGRGRSAALPKEGGAAPSPVPFLAPLGAADALAAQGRFSEAVHVLLLDTLTTLVRITGTALPPALTSREILGKIPLEPPARDALSHLVAAVETSLFAGRAADPHDYDACVEHVRRFSAVYQRAVA